MGPKLRRWHAGASPLQLSVCHPGECGHGELPAGAPRAAGLSIHRLPQRAHAGPAWGWRSPFVVVAIPTLILAVVVWFTVPEPERGITEAALQVRQCSTCLSCSCISNRMTPSTREQCCADLPTDFRSFFEPLVTCNQLYLTDAHQLTSCCRRHCLDLPWWRRFSPRHTCAIRFSSGMALGGRQIALGSLVRTAESPAPSSAAGSSTSDNPGLRVSDCVQCVSYAASSNSKLRRQRKPSSDGASRRLFL